jgi:hypothetical protein
MYMHLWHNPLAFCFPLSDPFLPPFYFLLLTWKPSLLWKDPVHPGPRLLVNWSPHFHPLPIPSTFQNPDPLGFSWAKCALTKTTSQTGLQVQNRGNLSKFVKMTLCCQQWFLCDDQLQGHCCPVYHRLYCFMPDCFFCDHYVLGSFYILYDC